MARIVSGPGTHSLAQALGKPLGATPVGTETKTFPDGEKYVRLTADVKGEDVVVVQTTYPPDRVWDLLLTLNACREAGAKSVRAVVPYLAYARQDRIFQPGESLSSRVVAEAISQAATEVVTVDVHKADVGRYFRIPFTNVSAEAPVAEHLKRLGVQVVLAPDAGARARAEAVARRIGVPSDHLEKRRISSEVVEMKPKTLDVRGKSVCILDDIISTGGTMAKALDQLKQQGARETYAVCVHGLFIGDAADKLRRAGVKEILSTNTIDGPYARISVVSPLVQALANPPAPLKARR